MLAPITLLLLLATPKPAPWYGPVRVTFDLPANGNPFDPEENDVRVRFTEGAHFEERLGYFDGAHWQAVLLTRTPGDYTTTILLNGRVINGLQKPLHVYKQCTTSFVEVAPNHRDFLIAGNRFWPVGHDLGWASPDLPPLPDLVTDMGRAGCTWARIWATDWDGKNLYWPQDQHRLPDGFLDMDAAAKWDDIVKAADESGVRFQWVLFHHGSFATQVDPNWNQSPWNAVNGGFLSDPKLFFTDANAIRHAKNILRYIVARYAHATSIMGWELFNEVENTDAARADDWQAIAAWHQNMAAYLRSIDPYHHLITTSSNPIPSLWRSMDYYQMHGYPENLAAMLASAKNPADKPFFFGEVGLSHDPTVPEMKRAIRDGIWASYLAGDSGAGMYWYWDQIQHNHLDALYVRSNEVLNQLTDIDPTSLIRFRPSVASKQTADLQLGPGLGWEASTKTDYDLPSDEDQMGKLSVFVQGKAHPDMGSAITFRFNSQVSGTIQIKVGTISRGGAHLTCSIDGQNVAEADFPAADRDHPVDKLIDVAYAAGSHVAVIANTGSDWAQVVSYRFSGLGSPLRAQAAEDGGTVVARLVKASGADAEVEFSLGGLPLPDGRYSMTEWNLAGAGQAYRDITVKGGKVVSPLALASEDEIVRIAPIK